MRRSVENVLISKGEGGGGFQSFNGGDDGKGIEAGVFFSSQPLTDIA